MKKKWLVLVAAAIFGATFAAAPMQSVNATSYKPYSYWFKKDLYGSKSHSVVLTKNITIRKIAWEHNNVGTYLSKSKRLKKGSHVKIVAYMQNNYCWTFYGKYSGWVYPHKTANWFESISEYNDEKEAKAEKKLLTKKTKKYDLFLKDNTFYIKNKGQLTVGDVIARDDNVNIFLSFTNTSKSNVNISEIFTKYLSVTTDTGQVLAFEPDDTVVKSNKSASVQLAAESIPTTSIGTKVMVAETSLVGVRTDDKSLDITLK